MEEQQKIWDKMILNSCYTPLASPIFRLYDEHMSAKITNEGSSIVNKIIEKGKELGYEVKLLNENNENN